VKVKNVARHIAQRRDHDSNDGTTAEPSRTHDYTDFDVERMDLDFDDTWEHDLQYAACEPGHQTKIKNSEFSYHNMNTLLPRQLNAEQCMLMPKYVL